MKKYQMEVHTEDGQRIYGEMELEKVTMVNGEYVMAAEEQEKIAGLKYITINNVMVFVDKIVSIRIIHKIED